MTSKDKAKVYAFVVYAHDAEGMLFDVVQTHGRWTAVPRSKAYDPQVVAAVTRNFNEEWRAFQGDGE